MEFTDWAEGTAKYILYPYIPDMTHKSKIHHFLSPTSGLIRVALVPVLEGG